MNEEQKRKLADAACDEIESYKMSAEKKTLYNRVLDRIEDFEATLAFEHDACGSDVWSHVKKVLYKVARAAIYCTRKGLGYIIAFIEICKKWVKKADLLTRMKNAWEGLTKRHPKEVFEEVTN